MNLQTRRTEPGVMPSWSIWMGAGVLLLVAAVSMWVLLSVFSIDNPADKNQLEANKIRLEIVKLSGSIVVGTGGAAALLLAARRQRSTELSIAQTERDLEYKERAATDSRHDANERRATELYTAATEQLGSDKAPVRLAGLYALERFGQTNIEYRQTVVNVLCSYLRMPFVHPQAETAPQPERDQADVTNSPSGRAMRLELSPEVASAIGIPIDCTNPTMQEIQVRLTAQRILTGHLQPDFNEVGVPTNSKFWEDISLDLTGAVLDNFELIHCRIKHASFNWATFFGRTKIKDSLFCGEVEFVGAHFADSFAVFESTFRKEADFRHTDFRYTSFFQVEFQEDALFDGGGFGSSAAFMSCIFRGRVSFRDTCFMGKGDFENSYFGKESYFADAIFHQSVGFDYSRFLGDAWFMGVKFHYLASFSGAEFYDRVSFRGATCRLDVNRKYDAWPNEWFVTRTPGESAPDPLDPNEDWGILATTGEDKLGVFELSTVVRWDSDETRE